MYYIIQSFTSQSSSTTLTLHGWATVQLPRKHYKMGGVTCHRMAQVVCLLLRVRSDQGALEDHKNNPNAS